MRYPLAPNGIFRTIQGEGHLLGVPMVFIRLAGCSVGCPERDTDYSVSERLDAQEIAQRVAGECLEIIVKRYQRQGRTIIDQAPTERGLFDELQQEV